MKTDGTREKRLDNRGPDNRGPDNRGSTVLEKKNFVEDYLKLTLTECSTTSGTWTIPGGTKYISRPYWLPKQKEESKLFC